MTELPSLALADWFAEPGTRRIFALLLDSGEEARIVGGAVRNALMGLPVADIDFATTATPDKVTSLAGAAGIKVVPTGIDHGTVTLVLDRHAYEVTTLRQDIETDGRHAVVRYGRDWTEDAERRDFTMNALSVDSDGRIHDPVGGAADIAVRRVRFIGDPAKRIAEDRLRILRLFRFHAQYGKGDVDPAALSASIRARHGLRALSGERLGQEMRKLVVARRAADTVAVMQDVGILPVVMGGVAYVRPFARTIAFAEAANVAMAPAARFAVLACRVFEDAGRITERLRLSNVERDRMLGAIEAAGKLAAVPDMRVARRLLYDFGPDAFRDGALLAAGWSGGREDDWRDLVALPERWAVPKFPLGGRDVIGDGVRGPTVGTLLRAIEAWWIAEDFVPDEATLRRRLQQMIAGQQ